MTNSVARSILLLLALTLVLSACSSTDSPIQQGQLVGNTPETKEDAVLVQYLEIVTPDVDATCAALEKMHGVRFGEPDPMLGNARTVDLKSGGRIGVRAPMAEHEVPVVRPYVLVDDIEAALKAAGDAGAEIAMGATEIPGHGKFGIYILGGIQHGLWQM